MTVLTFVWCWKKVAFRIFSHRSKNHKVPSLRTDINKSDAAFEIRLRNFCRRISIENALSSRRFVWNDYWARYKICYEIEYLIKTNFLVKRFVHLLPLTFSSFANNFSMFAVDENKSCPSFFPLTKMIDVNTCVHMR